MGNYGYDWTLSIPRSRRRGHKQPKPQVLDTEDLPVSDAWQRASDADADLDLDYDSLNPHFEYIDEDNNQRHVVWFLDGVTLLNEMRAARAAWLADLCAVAAGDGRQLAVERVGQAQQSGIAAGAGRQLQPGHDVDTEGEGDIMRVTGLPQAGQAHGADRHGRTRSAQEAHHRRAHGRVSAAPTRWSTTATIPTKWRFRSTTGRIPKWTPKILDILKEKNVKGTFLIIGEEARRTSG